MGFFSKLFGRKGDDEQQKAGGMEDFMTLIRVYFQAVMASDLGITNLAALPDLRVFKATLHVPTQNNKLGLAEKSRCKKMLKDIYGMSDDFTKEIEASIRKRCKKPQDIQTYMIQFSAFSQDLMMLTGNLMKFKLLGCRCDENRGGYPPVRPEVRLLPAVGYRLRLSCGDAGKEGKTYRRYRNKIKNVKIFT